MLEYITSNHELTETVLELNSTTLKKMLNRNNSNIHVNIKVLPKLNQQPGSSGFNQSDYDSGSDFEARKKKYKYFKEFMISMATHFQVNKTKAQDVRDAITKFKQATRKPVKSGLNYDSFDHYYHLTMNFSKLCSIQRTVKPSYIDKMRSRNHHKETELDRYVRSRIDYTFMIPENEQIICNLGYILKQLLVRIVSQKSDNLGLSSIHFRKVNLHLQKVFQSSQQDRKKMYGSKAHTPKVQTPRNMNTVSKPIQFIQDKNLGNVDENISQMIYTNESTNILPFLLNFSQGLLAKSIIITSKQSGDQYMLHKEEFSKLMGKLVNDTTIFYKDLETGISDFYTGFIKDEETKLKYNEIQIENLTESFSNFLENFHKLIEGKLAEDNFKVIYGLDKLTKTIKYTHYDTSVNYDNMKEKIAQEYDEELIKLFLVNKQLEDRLENYKKGMSLDIQQFVSENQNMNMIEMR